MNPFAGLDWRQFFQEYWVGLAILGTGVIATTIRVFARRAWPKVWSRVKWLAALVPKVLTYAPRVPLILAVAVMAAWPLLYKRLSGVTPRDLVIATEFIAAIAVLLLLDTFRRWLRAAEVAKEADARSAQYAARVGEAEANEQLQRERADAADALAIELQTSLDATTVRADRAEAALAAIPRVSAGAPQKPLASGFKPNELQDKALRYLGDLDGDTASPSTFAHVLRVAQLISDDALKGLETAGLVKRYSGSYTSDAFVMLTDRGKRFVIDAGYVPNGPPRIRR